MVEDMRTKVPAICDEGANSPLYGRLYTAQSGPKIAWNLGTMKLNSDFAEVISTSNKKLQWKTIFHIPRSDALVLYAVIMFVIPAEKSWGLGGARHLHLGITLLPLMYRWASHLMNPHCSTLRTHLKIEIHDVNMTYCTLCFIADVTVNFLLMVLNF